MDKLTLAFWVILGSIFILIAVLVKTQDDKSPINIIPKLSIDSRYYEIDQYTGFHYLSKNASSGFTPRYCIDFNGNRGHLRSKDDLIQCVVVNNGE